MQNDALMNTYGPSQCSLVRGEGCWVWDQNGKKYLDGLSGIAVCGLGHSHPSVANAVAEQAKELVHCSNFFSIPKQIQLAENLCEISKMRRVFFSNSGAEANEAAIKIARLHGNQLGLKLPTIVVMDNAFHGRTMATLSASGGRKVQAGFEPLVSGFVRAPFNDIPSLEKIGSNNANICAVFVEPIQGEGGINMPSKDYLNELQSLCKTRNWLLMIDEVQTGNGRTGKYFCYQHNNIVPDVVTTSKGLGNGVPIGACLASSRAADLMKPGNHGSTFGGNPLSCAAALASVRYIHEENLSERAEIIGNSIIHGLKLRLKSATNVMDIRGKGCMIGIQLDRPCKSLFNTALESGLIINVTADSVIRLLPPLIMNDDQINLLLDILAPLILNFVAD
ncbi:MAG: aspartate aminotransferase family protein [Cellvibrionales bacterium TMED49]|nr:MAG: aspartate aminotransferase family protein [Cellvibrionales bacterium TMED49]|tara:strand:+ start:315 stop:1493 length:1179 start_codon:yes stop_codon:yes gene_type:complete